jgi:hypothetical protein
MMKKWFVSILAILYFTVSSGMVVNIHYCMGKLSKVQLDIAAKDLCACKKSSSKKKMACCDTKYEVIKIQDDHGSSTVASSVPVPVKDLPPVLYHILVETVVSNVDFNLYQLEKPTYSGPDLLCHNSIFII